MRSSTSLKLASLVPVLYGTWFVTSAIMAQQIKKQPILPPSVTAKEVLTNSAASVPTPVLAPPIFMTYEYKLTSFSAKVEGAELKVASSVDLLDRKGDKVYLWRLQAFSAGTVDPVVDIPYDSQVFSIPASGKMSPTFAESIKLPAGQYQISLTLYAVPRGYDLALLLNEANSKEATVLRGSQAIEIK